MLVLFETPAGYALFQVKDEGVLSKVEDVAAATATPEGVARLVKLKAFKQFTDTTEALAAATALVDGTLDNDLKSFLKKSIVKKGLEDSLAVMDSKLGNIIKKKLDINVVATAPTAELFRGIRRYLSMVISGLQDEQVDRMRLGLGHSLGRYKLKFSPDKVDTMIVQAIGLLDELDKEINTYAMRVKEWYGWHFPELVKLVVENEQYARLIIKMQYRSNAADIDMSDILPTEVEQSVKEAAVVSMGTDISELDMKSITSLADEVIALMEYRTTLFDYLRNRMAAIAPNLSVMVGELVGARLIAHAGSLLNLAKQPASTVQILGAEKALFRALKTKHATPKYGLIFHASLVGQAAPKNKGKISRVLAAKTALSVRVDALGETAEPTIALEGRAAVENRLSQLEGRQIKTMAAMSAGRARTGNFDEDGHVRSSAPAAAGAGGPSHNAAADVVMRDEAKSATAASDDEADGKKKKKSKKEKKGKKRERAEIADADADADEGKTAAKAAKKQKKEKKEKKEKKSKKEKK